MGRLADYGRFRPRRTGITFLRGLEIEERSQLVDNTVAFVIVVLDVLMMGSTLQGDRRAYLRR